MPGLVCDPVELEALIRRRQETGADRYDEVWEGLYVMSPLANPEHQRMATLFASILVQVVTDPGHGVVYAGSNVTDQEEDWTHNYRCPDVVVVFNQSADRCRDIGPALLGGPDFLIEVLSPADKTFEKLEFYASLGVRELLVVDRDTKALRLFRLRSGELLECLPTGGWHTSEVVPLRFRTTADAKVEVLSTTSPARSWIV